MVELQTVDDIFAEIMEANAGSERRFWPQPESTSDFAVDLLTAQFEFDESTQSMVRIGRVKCLSEVVVDLIDDTEAGVHMDEGQLFDMVGQVIGLVVDAHQDIEISSGINEVTN